MTADSERISSRRQFLRRTGLAGLSALTARLALGAPAGHAADLPKLAEDDPTALALNYKHDAALATGRKDTAALCSNCLHYTGEPGSEWGPCAIFPGKQVSAKGWCIAWAQKTK